MNPCDCCTPGVDYGLTPFEKFEDVEANAEAVLDRIIELFPEIGLDRARAMLFTVLHWIRRGAEMDGDTETLAKLKFINIEVYALLPLPIPEGQLSLL